MTRPPIKSIRTSGSSVSVWSIERITVRVPRAAEMLGIGRTKLYELIADGEIDVVKLGRATLITMRSIEALIDRHKVSAANASTARRRGRPRTSFVGLGS